MVRRLFGRIEGEIGIVDIPLNEPGALERAADPFGDPLHQALELLRTRRRNRHEHQATFTLTPINAVEHEQVEMDIEIERAAEALYQGHCPCDCARTRQTGFANQMARDRSIDDTEHLRDHLGPRRQQVAQCKRQRQHPLANGLLRQDVVHEQCRRLGHPPRAAARAEAAAFATERDQLLGLAGVALDPQKAVLEQATLEIGVELVFHVPRQRPILGSASIPKRGIVLGHELV